jgi:hypothetical protein
MKNIVFSLCLLCIVTYGFAQLNSSPKRNTVYVEAFGQGLYNSLNYDRLIHTDRKIVHSISAGITYLPLSYLEAYGVPVSYNWVFGKSNHHLELGIGFAAMFIKQKEINVTYGFENSDGTYSSVSFIGEQTTMFNYITPKIGYRFQKASGGFFYRATLNPILPSVNIEGRMIGSPVYLPNEKTNIYYFQESAFFPWLVTPWLGMSFGYSF